MRVRSIIEWNACNLHPNDDNQQACTNSKITRDISRTFPKSLSSRSHSPRRELIPITGRVKFSTRGSHSQINTRWTAQSDARAWAAAGKLIKLPKCLFSRRSLCYMRRVDRHKHTRIKYVRMENGPVVCVGSHIYRVSARFLSPFLSLRWVISSSHSARRFTTCWNLIFYL